MTESKKPDASIHRCPHCGSSGISQDTKKGGLKCNYCKTSFKPVSANQAGDDVRGQRGDDKGVGAEDIVPGDDIVITLKCPSCGAQVVMNADEATSATCHWCHHILSRDSKVSNGAVPDLVLPFKYSREEAEAKIKSYLTEESVKNVDYEMLNNFKPESVAGVYFPYMIVDVNARMEMNGFAERTCDDGSSYADAYRVSREFDLLVDDLTVESSSSKLNQDTLINANYVINTILPFDTDAIFASELVHVTDLS